MIWTIARKEFLTSLLTYRFAVGLILCLVAATVGTLSVVQDYQNRQQAYQEEVDKYEKSLEERTFLAKMVANIQVFRPPIPLAVFSLGSDRWQGNVVKLSHHRVPVQANWLGSANPYLAVFRSIDVTTVVQVILGLLALLFACDAVSGQKEEGTLKMMLANRLPRDQFLLGTAIGDLGVLGAALATSFLAALLIVQATLGASTSLDAVAIFTIFLISLLYLTAIYAIGLLLSTASHRAATALVFALFFWTTAIAIYPNGVAYLIDNLFPMRLLEKQARDQVSEFNAEFHRQTDELTTQVLERPYWGSQFGSHGTYGGGVSGYYWGNFRTAVEAEEIRRRLQERGQAVPDYLREKTPEEIQTILPPLQKFFGRMERLRIEYADRIWTSAWRPVVEHMQRASAWQRTLAVLSPAGAYAEATAIVAGTDRGAYWHFLEATHRYRRELIAHLEEENLFEARAWFNDHKEKGDLTGFPRFFPPREGLWKKLGRARYSLTALLLFNLVGFLGAYWRFRRYDVR